METKMIKQVKHSASCTLMNLPISRPDYSDWTNTLGVKRGVKGGARGPLGSEHTAWWPGLLGFCLVFSPGVICHHICSRSWEMSMPQWKTASAVVLRPLCLVEQQMCLIEHKNTRFGFQQGFWKFLSASIAYTESEMSLSEQEPMCPFAVWQQCLRQKNPTILIIHEDLSSGFIVEISALLGKQRLPQNIFFT